MRFISFGCISIKISAKIGLRSGCACECVQVTSEPLDVHETSLQAKEENKSLLENPLQTYSSIKQIKEMGREKSRKIKHKHTHIHT